VEALEGTAPDHFVVAVQWHPERSAETDAASRAIFRAFVEAAACRRVNLARDNLTRIISSLRGQSRFLHPRNPRWPEEGFAQDYTIKHSPFLFHFPFFTRGFFQQDYDMRNGRAV